MARGPGWLAAAAWLLLAPRSEAGCAALGRCCRGRDLACVGTGWRPDRSHGACYCDQACPRALDCCHDYPRACPEQGSVTPVQGQTSRPSLPRLGEKEVSCVVSEWSNWSSCAEPCQATYRVRRRHVLQEPSNGGEVCPPLEEKAGCMEYWTQQGAECKQSLVPALITTGGYGKARKKRAASTENERPGYCVEFQLTTITEGCVQGNSSYTRWMRYLSKGHTVCVECQYPALDSRSLHCSGDGSDSDKNQLLHWQAMGNSRCRGTWKRVRQLDACSCPSINSFLFI